MTPVRLEPAALRSRVKHSTTEPLGSLISGVTIVIILSLCTHVVMDDIIKFPKNLLTTLGIDHTCFFMHLYLPGPEEAV